MVKYFAAWFDEKTNENLYKLLGENFLSKKPEDPLHVTFSYRPSDEHLSQLIHYLGLEFEILIIGIGNNGENSGFEVEIPLELQSIYNGSPKVHITMSLSEKGAAKNIANLDFVKISPPIKVKSRFGFYVSTEEGEKVIFE